MWDHSGKILRGEKWPRAEKREILSLITGKREDKKE